MSCGHLHCAEVILQLLVFGLSNGAILALNAIGITVVYSTVRTLNLAHGDVFALTSVLVTTLLNAWGVQSDWPTLSRAGALALTLGIAILFGAALNVGIEQIAFRPFRGRSRLAPLIATLGVSFILYQIALIWRTTTWVYGVHHGDGGPVNQVPLNSIPDLLPTFNLIKALGWPLNVTLGINNVLIWGLAGAGAVGVSLFLSRTHIGRAIRACSQNPQLAQLCGVNPDAAIRQAFAFGGGLAGAAAFVFTLYYSRSFGQHGAQSGLLAFTAALLGGVGSPVGALASGLILGGLSAFSDYFLAAQWTPVLLQVVLIGLLVLRPTGLSGDESRDEATTLAPSARAGVSGGRDAVTGMLGQRTRLNREWVWGLAALAVILPLGVSEHSLVLLTGIGLLVMLALGLNILLGHAGILDLGYAVSYGVGAYTAAMLTNRWGSFGSLLPQPVDFILVLAVSATLAALFGALKGLLALRLRSDYLAVVTVAISFLAHQVILNLRSITGGDQGIAALPPPSILGYTLTNPIAHYYLVFGFIVVLAIASQRLLNSRIGRGWLAVGGDETAASATGVDVARHNLLALAFSSALAGMAGALNVALFAYVAPELADFPTSALVLGMVILGGAGSVPGAILGGLLLAGYGRIIIPRLAEVLAQLQPGQLPIPAIAPDIRGLNYLNFGLALYLTVLVRGRRKGDEA
jgi:branched-chain amino acid transport system permease protein